MQYLINFGSFDGHFPSTDRSERFKRFDKFNECDDFDKVNKTEGNDNMVVIIPKPFTSIRLSIMVIYLQQ